VSKINQERKPLIVECEDCKQEFEIASDEVMHSATCKKEFNVNGQSIFLTYYDCPSCGRRHYVQIDDKASLNKSKEVSRQFAKLSAAKRKGKEIPQKQSVKFKKARQYLADYRMNLMKQYAGRLIYDNETNSDFVLRFSV